MSCISPDEVNACEMYFFEIPNFTTLTVNASDTKIQNYSSL
jgi:hypothetical protein